MSMQIEDVETWRSWWPSIEPRLVRHVQRRSGSRSTAEDVVQDVAIKLFTRRPELEDVEAAFRWARTVCDTTLIDHHRRRLRVDGDGLPELVATDDVAASVEHRSTLAAALTAVESLSESDRAALWSQPEVGLPRDEQVRRNMRRMRARKRLALLLAGVAGVVGGIRRLLVPAITVTAATLVAVILLLGAADEAPRPTEADAPAVDTAIAGDPIVAVVSASSEAARSAVAPASVVIDVVSSAPASGRSSPAGLTPTRTVDAPATYVRTYQDTGHPEGAAPTACVEVLAVNRCVDRPGPDLGGVVTTVP